MQHHCNTVGKPYHSIPFFFFRRNQISLIVSTKWKRLLENKVLLKLLCIQMSGGATLRCQICYLTAYDATFCVVIRQEWPQDKDHIHTSSIGIRQYLPVCSISGQRQKAGANYPAHAVPNPPPDMKRHENLADGFDMIGRNFEFCFVSDVACRYIWYFSKHVCRYGDGLEIARGVCIFFPQRRD